jgi:hypothetical protein
MYNINFIVKYYDIKQDLLVKLQNNSENLEYSESDIENIINKLYRDELISVFYAENITDDKIDQGIHYIMEKLLSNNHFREIMVELRTHFKNYISELVVDSDNNNNNNTNIDFIIFLTLFSDKIFYITHKCICQQILKEFIYSDLLNLLYNLTLACLSD